MRRCFREIEGHELGGADSCGDLGPLKVSVHGAETPLTRALIAAGGEMGLAAARDVNEAASDGGIGYATRTVHRGVRMSAARAFLKPALRRPNLTILTDTQVLRVRFDGVRAEGVELRDAAGLRHVDARCEVILCAGAVETPKLLQLSGVGPGARLRRFGIPVVAERREVGENLREHLNAPLKYRVSSGAFGRDFQGARLAWNALRYALHASGPMTHAAQEIVAFARSTPDQARPDIQLGFTLLSWIREPGRVRVDPGHTVTVHNYYTRPTSRGSCHIQSLDPGEPPAIDANYLATEEDRRHSIDGARFAARLMGRPALSAFRPEPLGPAPKLDTDEAALETLEALGRAAFHVAGTCRMGADAGSVVDPQLRVRGVDRLRVVDTSVMPELTSGNTNAPTMAMAWRAAELILA
jgi:choline dehydrogenase-like flavoprotein